MLLKSGDGVECDKCGSEHRGSFTYFSLDIIPVPTVGGKTPIDRRKRKISSSLDTCEACMSKLSDAVIATNSKQSKNLRCDHCGCTLAGKVENFCKVSKVLVLNGDTNVDENYLELYLCNTIIKELGAKCEVRQNQEK